MKTLGKVLAWALLAVAVLLVIAWFALRRPDVSYAELEAAYADAESEYMGVPGAVRAHYRDQGNPDGPVLVMIHGYSASTDTWAPWAQRLGADYRIISIDLPGHGLTRAPEGYAPTIDGFADYVDVVTRQIGVQSFTLIGNSMGGATAWTYALKYPQRLDGLVLVDSAGWIPQEDVERPAVFDVLASPAGRAVLGKIESTPLVRDGLRAAFYPEPDMADEAMVTRYVQMARAPGHRDILFGLIADRTTDSGATAEKMAAITTPTLIMHGDSDKLIPVSAAHRFDETIPNSTLIVYEQTGHIPMEQIPDKSAGDLKAWLTEKVYPAEPSPLAGEGGPRSGSDEGSLRSR